MMLDAPTDGRLQVTAGASFLELSRLVIWDRNHSRFEAVPLHVFADRWRTEVHPVFGRVNCWMTFSAGAEIFAKGLCLLHDVEIRQQQSVLDYPSGTLADWVSKVTQGTAKKVQATNYGQLGDLWRGKPGKVPPALERICSKQHSVPTTDRDMLIAAYQLLGSTIRNRDAHAYVPKVRDAHFSLVAELLVPCFNLLASWLPGGSSVLTTWIDETEQFIAGL